MKPPVPPSVIPQILGVVAIMGLAWFGVQFYKSYQLNKEQFRNSDVGRKLLDTEISYLVSVRSTWNGNRWSNEFRPANEWVITGEVRRDGNNWELEWEGHKIWCQVDQSYGPYTIRSQICEKIREVKAIGLEQLHCK